MCQIDMQKLADDARFNRFHVKVLLWCLLILIIDGYDIAVVGIALPSIMQQMGVNASTAGFMASSALFGMMFGAMVLGTLSDRIGRRWALSIGVMLFSVFTAAAGFTKDPISFSVVRFIAGLGIGGVLPVIVAQMVEYSPKKIRSLMTALMTSGYALGGILAAVLGKQLIGEYGWQAVFIAAGVPVLLVPFILKLVPESMTYLIAQRRNGELAEVARHLQPGGKHPADAQFFVPAADRMAGAPVTRLFQDGRGLSTALFWVAFFSGLFMVYALSSWLTKLMAMAGYSLGSALSFVIALNVGAIIGAVCGGWLADKFNIKWVLVAMYALGGVLLYLMTFQTLTEVRYLIIGAVGACTTGAQLVAYAFCGQFYPMSIRSTGIGMASGVGRLGAIAAPLLIGQIVALELPLEQNFLVIGGFGVLGAIALAFIKYGGPTSATPQEAVPELRPLQPTPQNA